MAFPVSLLKEGKKAISPSQVKLEDLQENGLEKVPCVPWHLRDTGSGIQPTYMKFNSNSLTE